MKPYVGRGYVKCQKKENVFLFISIIVCSDSIKKCVLYFVWKKKNILWFNIETINYDFMWILLLMVWNVIEIGVQGFSGSEGLNGPKGGKGEPGLSGPRGPKGNNMIIFHLTSDDFYFTTLI